MVGEWRHVRCPECGADMSPLREFCPSCGAAAAQGLRRRDPGSPEGRSPEELKRNRKTVLIVCAAIVGVFAVGGRMHFPFPPVHINLDHHDHGSKGPVTINAVDLARAYAADPGAAETRFAGREIMVSGDSYGSSRTAMAASTCA